MIKFTINTRHYKILDRLVRESCYPLEVRQAIRLRLPETIDPKVKALVDAANAYAAGVAAYEAASKADKAFMAEQWPASCKAGNAEEARRIYGRLRGVTKDALQQWAKAERILHEIAREQGQ